MSSRERARVFVYGSLKRGERHQAEMAGARFVAAVRTAPAYTLVDAGTYPGLIETGTTAIAGELYEVDAALLARLDEFEEVPDAYRRGTVRLESGQEALAYFLPLAEGERLPAIPSGRWPSRER